MICWLKVVAETYFLIFKIQIKPVILIEFEILEKYLQE